MCALCFASWKADGKRRDLSRAARLERLDAHRIELEAEYLEALISALRVTASGKWGLFGHNEHLEPGASRLQLVTDLCDRGQEIDSIRERLGLDEFPLHQEFEDSRGRVSSQSLGEPKQAKAWLERLGKTL